MFNEKIFSERLKELRLSKNLTLKQLGLILNVTMQTVGHWETSYRTPPIDKVYSLADFFDVSIDYLVGRTDDPTIYKYKSKALRFSEDRNIQEDYNPIRDILRNLPKNTDK